MSSWPQPDPDKLAAHQAKNKVLYAEMKEIEERFRPGYSYLQSPEWDAAHKAWRQHYNSCRQCGSTDVRVEDYDMMWHDGDIVCNVCGCYVRGYDAG